MIKYFQIMKTGLSYELDSDIHYYHHFKIGELLVCDMVEDYLGGCWGMEYKRVITYDTFHNSKWDNGISLYRNTYQGNKVFTLNWDSTKSQKIDFVESIKDGYLVDVTKCVNREWKLELIGI